MQYIDFHCDTLSRIFYKVDTDNTEILWSNKGHVDLSRLSGSGCLAQFFACFLDRKTPAVSGTHYQDALEMIRLMKDTLALHPEASLALSYEDYLHNKANRLLSCFLTVEEGGILDGNVERLPSLYEAGIRLITLTWNYENDLGCPHNMSSVFGTGLKPFGFEVLSEMERLGMLIDVSHLSDAGFEDVYCHTHMPFVASHSCCRSLCGHSRNLTDEMIRKIGERQGLIGVNFYGTFLQDDGRSTLNGIIRHLRHIINTGGLDVAALGSDFDGMDCEMELTGCQDMPKLIPALEKAGFSPHEIDAVCFKNSERILQLL